jgi:hypothetical protein
MPTQLTQLFEPGKTPLPVIWHDSAWRPRVTVRRGYLRRLSLNRLQVPTDVSRFTFHASRITHHASRHPSPSPSPVTRHPSLSPWPRRTFIFSRLPCYPLTRLSKL